GEVLDSVDKTTCAYHKPMKTKKVNIGSDVEPKEAITGDYWLDYEVSKILEILWDYQDLFPRGYHELKGVHESLWEMKINLKEGACPVRKRPYRMNPNLHEKVKEEIEKMLKSGIIKPLDESKW
ncbi:hypothetical protein KI387_006702, partial [Taxus chinensis]